MGEVQGRDQEPERGQGGDKDVYLLMKERQRIVINQVTNGLTRCVLQQCDNRAPLLDPMS